MANVSIKSTQIILFHHSRLTTNMLLFTIESSGIYIHNVVLKPWRISCNWAVVVFLLLCSQSLESDVAVELWYHQIFFYVIYEYIQVHNSAKVYFTCAVYFYVHTCAIILNIFWKIKMIVI
jgi:hypothetical protein